MSNPRPALRWIAAAVVGMVITIGCSLFALSPEDAGKTIAWQRAAEGVRVLASLPWSRIFWGLGAILGLVIATIGPISAFVASRARKRDRKARKLDEMIMLFDARTAGDTLLDEGFNFNENKEVQWQRRIEEWQSGVAYLIQDRLSAADANRFLNSRPPVLQIYPGLPERHVAVMNIVRGRLFVIDAILEELKKSNSATG